MSHPTVTRLARAATPWSLPDTGAQRWRPLLLGSVLALVCLTQLGCGFRLRGSVEIPPDLNPIFIQAGGGSPVRGALVDQLSGGQVRIAPSAQDAKLILRILSEGQTSRVVAVDSAGRVLSYELRYLVSYDAVGADGAQKVPAQSLDLVRTFDNPDVEVLSRQLEEQLIYEDFARDAADRILMRLRVALDRASSPSS